MGVFKRLGNILSGKANKVLDEMENPVEQIEVAIRQRSEAVTEAKRKAASFIGQVSEKERELSDLTKKISDYEEGIRTALKNNDEAKAKTFLTKVKELQSQKSSVETTLAKTREMSEMVKSNIAALEKELETLKTKKSELAARYASAKATSEINEIFANVNKDVNISLDDIERKIQDKENYATGLNSFKKSNPDDELAEYLNQAGSSDMDSELDKYR